MITLKKTLVYNIYLKTRSILIKSLLQLLVVLAILVCFIVSCGSPQSEGINIDINKREKTSIYDIFDKIEVIPLETNDISIIKDISKLMIYKDKYYILDYPMSKILVFNEDGSFSFVIDRKGYGPEEYINISDVEINKTNGNILLLSSVNRTVYEYDNIGAFIDNFQLPVINGAYQYFKYICEDTLAFWTFDYKNRVKMYSMTSKEIFKEGFQEKDLFYNKFLSTVFPYENYLTRSSMNEVYQIMKTGEINIAYEWDFGENNNTKTIRKNIEFISQKEAMDFAHKVFSSDIVNYIFVLHGGNKLYNYAQIYRKNKPVNIFHNKITGINIIFEQFIEKVSFHPVYWTDEFVIGMYPNESYLLNEIIPDEVLTKDNSKIKNKWNELDNPLLIKYFFKK